jgi:PAS domain S-box-containing protein
MLAAITAANDPGGNGVLHLEYRAVLPDGSVRWLNLRGRTTFRGEGERRVPARSAGVVFDITERRNAQEILRESEAKYRSLFDASIDAVMLTALDGRILEANEAACRLFGRSREELRRVGRDGVADSSDSRWSKALEDRVRIGRFQGVLTFVRADGSTFQGELSFSRCFDADGQPRGSAVIRDVTERLRADQELRAARDQAHELSVSLVQAREDERTRLAREIHDVLAQDLTRLKIDLVRLQNWLSDPAASGAPGFVAAQVTQMIRLADTTIRTVQHLATELRPAVLDSLGLSAAIDWCVGDFASRTGLDCSVDVPDDEPGIDRVTATAVFRIVQESLSNVQQHASATTVAVRLQADLQDIRVLIEDDGWGIPPGALESPRSLGLAGMRERAQSCGGQIDIGLRPGGGTRIDLRLPVVPPERRSEGRG